MILSDSVATKLAEDILKKLGAPPGTARRIRKSLTLADSRSVPTHGLSLLPLYAELIKDGIINPAAMPEVVSLGGSIVRVDGRGAFGQLTAGLAVESCLALLPANGIAAAGIVDGTHLGRLGEWAEQACAQNAIFVAFTNAGGGARNVAGPDSARRVLSTNPVAIGVPSCGALDHHVIVDFASSQTSGSRIREVANSNGRLDPDWLVSANGSTTDDPGAFFDGVAALRPLGGRSAGHKGFGLMVAGELLAALAGNLMAGERRTGGFTNGALFCLLDAGRFVDSGDWAQRVKHFRDYLSDHDCRLPGSGKATVGHDTLGLKPHVVRALVALASNLGIHTHDIDTPSLGVGVTRTW